MDLADLDPTDYELQTDVDACLQRCGATMDQVTRWRREGLLSDVLQRQTPYRGSEVLYPKGTCAQIAATRRLFKKRNRVEFVGFELWWEGYPVDEKYWRPKLINDAKWIDWAVAKLRATSATDAIADGAPTVQEHLASTRPPNIILSRIYMKLQDSELAAFFGVFASLFEGSVGTLQLPPVNSNPTGDEHILLKGLDFLGTEQHAVLGQSLKFRAPLQAALQGLATVLTEFTYCDAARSDTKTINAARADARNGLRIALALYDSVSWVYGPRAFGLRFAAWIAHKYDEPMARSWTLGMVLLRRANLTLLSSSEIGQLADFAETVREYSMRAKQHADGGGRFADLYSAKAFRRSFRNEVTHSSHVKQIEDRRDSESH